MKTLIQSAMVGTLLFSACSHATLRTYTAEIAASEWRIAADNPLKCQLVHPIPRWGRGIFTSVANKDLNLEFELQGKKQQALTQQVELRVQPPGWQPGSPSHPVTQVKFFKQFNGFMTGAIPWQMLEILNDGLSPTFLYRDWYRNSQWSSIALSSASFHSKYDAFLDCIANLLPYSYNDIRFSVLTYRKSSSELTSHSKRRLQMIGDYLKAAPDLRLMLVHAYSDSYGGQWMNLQLSKKRAEMVKNYFVKLGIESKRIQSEGYGEKRHIAPNNNAVDRAKNRRVVISIENDTAI